MTEPVYNPASIARETLTLLDQHAGEQDTWHVVSVLEDVIHAHRMNASAKTLRTSLHRTLLKHFHHVEAQGFSPEQVRGAAHLAVLSIHKAAKEVSSHGR